MLHSNTVGLSLLACLAGSLASPAHAGPWADRVVFGIENGEAVYTPGVAEGAELTFGPFHSSALWNTPASVLGKPNTLDYDDLEGWGPVGGGFAGGPMHEISIAWSAWQYGSNDHAHLGERPGWDEGRRENGLGLAQGGQIVVEFDEPIDNNPHDGGAYHWGADFIVHGNAFFASDRAITAETSMDAVTLGTGVTDEPVTVSVAQEIGGPWYTFDRTADGLYPTQPFAWNSDTGAWSDSEQDWRKPVNPALTAADFAGLTGARGIELYEGSAGGTPFDLSDLRDEDGEPANLAWIRFVRFTDPDGNGGEICGIADVSSAPACGDADFAEPYGVLDLSDITGFIDAFGSGDTSADLAEPYGVLDLTDLTAFVASFVGGCP